jgi:NADH pyrophosphatase NudC (nudix superfamily)
VASSDLALFHVLRMKRLVPEALLKERLAAARTRGVPLEEVLRVARDLEPPALARALEARARHARRCAACGEATYLQPGQTGATTPCERCGGALLPRPSSGRLDRA